MSTRSPLLLLCFVALPSGCGSGAQPVDATVATFEPIRGTINIDGEVASPLARVGPGQRVDVPRQPGEGAGGGEALGRLRLDGGPRVLLGPSAHVTVIDTNQIEATGGRLFVQVEGGENAGVGRLRRDGVYLRRPHRGQGAGGHRLLRRHASRITHRLRHGHPEPVEP